MISFANAYIPEEKYSTPLFRQKEIVKEQKTNKNRNHKKRNLTNKQLHLPDRTQNTESAKECMAKLGKIFFCDDDIKRLVSYTIMDVNKKSSLLL